jgi:twinkle protein
MGKIVKKNLKCLSKDCSSSDARQLYENGTSFCFSCEGWFPKQDNEELEVPEVRKAPDFFKKLMGIEEIQELPIRGFKERGITKQVCEFFDVRVSYGENGEIDAHYYPYDDGKAYKVRKLPKDFTWTGKSSNLFGQTKFNGAGKRLIITEGEIDALSVAQASYDKYKKVYPVVAMSSATMTKALLENRDWIRSFNEIVLCLDNDDAGKKATEEAIKIIGIDKAKLVKLPCKDANEVLTKFDSNRLMQCIFDAAPYVPAGIIGKEELWEALQNYNNAPSVPYPPCLAGVNTKLKGMRGGEITLFISGTGSGKSTILREIMLDILFNTEDKIGIVSLEESPAETARKLAGMAINLNPAKEEIPLNKLKIGFDSVFASDRVVLLDHQGSINDNSIVDQLEYMCLVGCKYLFIDHITILVSEGVENLTGNEAQDKVMNDLLRLVKRHPQTWIGLVSHLRKAPNNKGSFEEGRLPSIDDIRGSGSIKQISFDIISFARNLTADSEVERNTIKMRILKSRYTGLTGDVKGAHYVYDTGRLVASTADVEEFVTI